MTYLTFLLSCLKWVLFSLIILHNELGYSFLPNLSNFYIMTASDSYYNLVIPSYIQKTLITLKISGILKCNYDTLHCRHPSRRFIIRLQIQKPANRRGASDSVTDSSVLSNPADAQNVSFLGLCGRDICPKSSA